MNTVHLFSLQSYIVSHIDEQQALVLVEHASGVFNLYLSDITGVYFSLSLPDIVTSENGISFDLELVCTIIIRTYIDIIINAPKISNSMKYQNISDHLS